MTQAAVPTLHKMQKIRRHVRRIATDCVHAAGAASPRRWNDLTQRTIGQLSAGLGYEGKFSSLTNILLSVRFMKAVVD
jgi:hypothetical protein